MGSRNVASVQLLHWFSPCFFRPSGAFTFFGVIPRAYALGFIPLGRFAARARLRAGRPQDSRRDAGATQTAPAGLKACSTLER